MRRRDSWHVTAVTTMVLAALLTPGGGQAGGSPLGNEGTLTSRPRAGRKNVRIEVLSNRADLISGDDAYVEILLPKRANPKKLRVRIGKRKVTRSFAVRPDGRILGVVDGLHLGRNVLRAKLRHGRGARITITNYPFGGPVFAGAQVQPWICDTEALGLGPAEDEQCNTDPVYTYEYKSAESGQFTAYDPENPPPSSQIETTTTDQGETVPYIVRVERGVIDRGVYDIAVLFDPTQDWKPWAAQAGWNHKLLVPGGAGCDPGHRQVGPPSVMDDQALSLGFAVLGTALSDNTQNCNDVVQAEATMMVKEHLIETYGEVRYTIGKGSSGGSMFQHSVAANYPGLLDGIQPGASFPDIWTTFQEMADCKLLSHYFNETSPHLWTEQQRAWASGHQSLGTCEFMAQARADSYVSATGNAVNLGLAFGNTAGPCGGNDWTYDPQTNPGGARCGLQDYQVSTFGRRASDGFANRPYDTVGVQFGLAALEAGQILAEQFVDLNEKIGGLDIDGSVSTERSEADLPAVRTAYRSGRLNTGAELAKVPIIDLRTPGNAEEHFDFHSWQMRFRLLRDNGYADNHLIWYSSPGGLSFTVLDEWLAAIEQDTSSDSLEAKVVRHRPAEAVDACWIGSQKVTDMSECTEVFPYYGNPRTASGAPPTGDLIKCQLKPLERTDYSVTLTDAQWTRLQETFPTGVCDYSKPSVGYEAPAGPWMTFAGGPGGQPLGPAPTSRAIR